MSKLLLETGDLLLLETGDDLLLEDSGTGELIFFGTVLESGPADIFPGITYDDDAHLTTTGGRIAKTNLVTGVTTLDATYHVVFCDTDGGVFTVNLPAGVEGTHYKIINCGSSGNDLTVDPNGVEELYGAGAGVASTLADGEVIDIHYNDTHGWY